MRRLSRPASLALAACLAASGAVAGAEPERPAAPATADAELPSTHARELVAHADDGHDFSPGARFATRVRDVQSSDVSTLGDSSREVFGFLPWWQLDDPELTLDFDALTTVAYFGVGATGQGRLARYESDGSLTTGWAGWTSSRLTAIANEAHRHGARVVLTVQRFAWNESGERETIALLSSATARRALAGEIASVIAARGADGVNLDFEPIPDGQRANYVTFVRDVRHALEARSPAYQLTFDATRHEWLAGYDLAALTAPDAADAVFLMGYDYRIPSSLRAGSIAPLDEHDDDLSRTLATYLSQTTPDKVILGLPYYGRAWSTTTDDLNALTRPPGATYGPSRSVLYDSAVGLASEHGRRYDSAEQSAWTAYRYRNCADCPLTWRQLYFDDVRSLDAKYRLAVSLGLRGTGIWALGYDGRRNELNELIKRVVHGDESAPRVTPPYQRVRTDSTVWYDAVSTRVSWSGEDTGGSGLARFELAQRRDGGAWISIALPSPLATSVWRTLAPGSRYEFRVRGRDEAGNVGAWAYGPAFTVRLFQEGSGLATYAGRWTRRFDETASGRYVASSTDPGASARFAFSGRTFALVAPRGPTRGVAEVFIDGVHATSIDLRAASQESRRVVYARSWPHSGSHVVRIRVDGTPARPRVDVDAFVVFR